MLPAPSDSCREDDLGYVDRRVAGDHDGPDDEHGAQLRCAEHEIDAVANVAPVSARQRLLRLEASGRDARDESGGERERHGVDPVRRIRAERSEDHARHDRADDPGEVLDPDEKRVGLRQVVLVGDEVRHARVDGRAEEAGRDPVTRPRERRSPPAVLDERERAEDTGPDEVGRRPSAAGAGSGRPAARSTSPITTIGRKSATRSAATQVPEPVKAKMFSVSATAARYVPNAEPAVARKSSLKWCPRRRRFRRPETRTRESSDRRLDPKADSASRQGPQADVLPR